MAMSFDKYIDNPSGGSVFINRSMYKAMYKEKFDKVLVREDGSISYTIYRTNDTNDTFYIYIKVPSEVIDKFYYDVVIKLYTLDNQKKDDATLRRYSVQFYSNDPAFVYTFAHSFNKNKLFIPELSQKMSKQALANKASVRNPKDNVWYVKSLFFAYLTMEKYGLFNRSMLNQRSVAYKKSELLQRIIPADIKIRERQKAQELLDAEKKAEKLKAKQQRQQHLSTHIKPTKVAKISHTSKVSLASKKTKTTKITKKK